MVNPRRSRLPGHWRTGEWFQEAFGVPLPLLSQEVGHFSDSRPLTVCRPRLLCRLFLSSAIDEIIPPCRKHGSCMPSLWSLQSTTPSWSIFPLTRCSGRKRSPSLPKTQSTVILDATCMKPTSCGGRCERTRASPPMRLKCSLMVCLTTTACCLPPNLAAPGDGLLHLQLTTVWQQHRSRPPRARPEEPSQGRPGQALVAPALVAPQRKAQRPKSRCQLLSCK